jgi:ABC-type uncharacterized transport system YnjBCD substrate-binding protein
MTKIYNKTIKSIQDPAERARVLQPIWEYVDSLDVVENTGNHKLKSVVSTMQSAKDQFATLVSLLVVFTRRVLTVRGRRPRFII